MALFCMGKGATIRTALVSPFGVRTTHMLGVSVGCRVTYLKGQLASPSDNNADMNYKTQGSCQSITILEDPVFFWVLDRVMELLVNYWGKIN